MFWLFLYVYVIGVVNDVMFALAAEADFSDWKTHVSIAFWPISVPYAVIGGVIEAITSKK